MTTTRKNITQPAEWWAAFEAQAAKDGLTLSEWIGAQCLAALPKSAKKCLPERPAANRPKNVQ